jgi:antibiotic biosynthesis monooxygenase (ABM) superfamily enzyme
MKPDTPTVTIVTQTCVREDSVVAFAAWQEETSQLIAKVPGFLEQKVMPPSPPLQVDWVILQRFVDAQSASGWLNSPDRQQRIVGVAPLLVGRDDVHIVSDDAGARPSPVAAVISTRVKAGKEADYRLWERKIAAAQARAAGFQGYRFEPPVPGVQEDFVAILRFDTEANLQTWLDSPERKKLVDEAASLTEEFHSRVVRNGFEHWFADSAAAVWPGPAAWKMNMLVLLMLYPIVFLFGTYVGTPLLSNKLGLSFPVALFLGNIVSVSLTGVLIPWAAGHLGWWLQPPSAVAMRNSLAGGVALLACYATMVLVFWKFF